MTRPRHDRGTRQAGGADLVALEHGAAVLAMELARLRGIADTELRLRRDLRRPHRVVLVESKGRVRSQDALLHAVRRALRQVHQPGLCESWSGQVAVVTAGQAD